MSGHTDGLDPAQHPCAAHKDHGSAVPLLTEFHHVQPLGMGGADLPGNKVPICPTGHYNTHHLLGCLVFIQPLPAHFGRTEMALARQGFDAWVAAGKPGNPQAAWG